jgi:hypothetical protein
MFHLPVVLEKRNVIGRRFDAEDKTALIVHLDRCRSHCEDPTGGGPILDRVSGVAVDHGRTYKGFNFFAHADAAHAAHKTRLALPGRRREHAEVVVHCLPYQAGDRGEHISCQASKGRSEHAR